MQAFTTLEKLQGWPTGFCYIPDTKLLALSSTVSFQGGFVTLPPPPATTGNFLATLLFDVNCTHWLFRSSDDRGSGQRHHSVSYLPFPFGAGEHLTGGGESLLCLV